jgi:hypothetical protein
MMRLGFRDRGILNVKVEVLKSRTKIDWIPQTPSSPSINRLSSGEPEGDFSF